MFDTCRVAVLVLIAGAIADLYDLVARLGVRQLRISSEGHFATLQVPHL